LTNFDFNEFKDYLPSNETNVSTIMAELLQLIKEDSYALKLERLKFDDQNLKIIGICAKSQKNVFADNKSGLFYYEEHPDLKKEYINYSNQIEFFRDSIESIEFWLFNYEKEVNISLFLNKYYNIKQINLKKFPIPSLKYEINLDNASELIQSLRIQEYVKKKVENSSFSEEFKNETLIGAIKLYFKNIIEYLQKTSNKNSLVKLIDQIKMEYKVCITLIN